MLRLTSEPANSKLSAGSRVGISSIRLAITSTLGGVSATPGTGASPTASAITAAVVIFFMKLMIFLLSVGY